MLASDLAFMRWKTFTPHGLHLQVKAQPQTWMQDAADFVLVERTKKGAEALSPPVGVR